ncbi:DUF4917 family protein [Pseudomonas rubra]|uniref:DUF4917 family protein n=1 Tax=Pseudomonas rubra TaxID=2942627 RepID=A0ABT5PBS2_9PSED|nr:DUF4917 family protein [Pseudomonas rubra]MDD1015394.1 DUF4917 family protein [Pseudomonas rubra]MDD1039616.1 DUF4917 family protein [Pseudomonas rubra]MDD1153958.1 DUF4917 family protein [Pseudomonas rubra]
MPHANLDASLNHWPDLNASHPCSGLLLGNGASRALWRPFSYFSLFEEALRVRHKPLNLSDQALFKSQGTELFEPVLSALNTTVRINAALAISSSAPLNRYYAIKEALIHAIRSVHIPWRMLPSQTLQLINRELGNYQSVYSSNYDLICHWAASQKPEGFQQLFDEDGGFDIRRTRSPGTRLLYLHGGLHLLKQQDGSTRQRSATDGQLLDGFAVNTPGDVPMFVNESSSDDKLKAIRSSDYLSWALGELAGHQGGLCIFGQHLDSTDQHLLQAIKQARPAHLAIAIRPLSDASIISQKQHYVQRFADTPALALYFFDASSHPLGTPGLEVAVPVPIRKRH